jgi:hypothetical protein
MRAMHIQHSKFCKKKKNKRKLKSTQIKTLNKTQKSGSLQNAWNPHKIHIVDHKTKNLQTTQNTQTLEPPINITQKTKRIHAIEESWCKNSYNAKTSAM